MRGMNVCRRCTQALLMLLTLVLFPICGGAAPVPVTVSTMFHSLPSLTDVAVDGAGNWLLLTRGDGVYRGLSNGDVTLIVSFDGNVNGMACDVAANVLYVTSYDESLIYRLDLGTRIASTLAGSIQGAADGVGPYGIVHYAPTGLLYVADYNNGAVRKIVVATANVTTVIKITITSSSICTFLCGNENGTLLYLSTDTAVVKVNLSQVNATATVLAGSTTYGYEDGIGEAARFSGAYGIALTPDESGLIIADRNNRRIRHLELSTNNVTTIAGNGTMGISDGPGLNATFGGSMFSAKWHCTAPSMRCGVLVADYDKDAVRFVAIEGLSASQQAASETQLTQPMTASSTPAFPARQALTVPTATAAATAALAYAALISGGVGGGAVVSSTQRSIAALRLSLQCTSQGEGPDVQGPREPMFSQLLDNPLGLSLPVDHELLGYAAGAAVGNLLVVGGVAACLHGMFTLQQHAGGGSGRCAALVRLLPGCSVPGSFAGAFGKLVQPAVGAAVALLTFAERSSASAVCGIVMLVLWAAYPLYCVVAVRWWGRRRGSFVLASKALHPTRRERKERTHAAAQAMAYISRETREWVLHPGCTRRGTSERAYADFLLHRMEAVFGGFVGGREWYFAVEWGIAAVSGAVLGAAEASALVGDACSALFWGGGSAIALGVLQLALCAWLRPYSVRLEQWMALLLVCLELLSNALSLAGLADVANLVVLGTTLLELIVVLVLAACTLAIQRPWRQMPPDSLVQHRATNVRKESQLPWPSSGQQLAVLIELACTYSAKWPPLHSGDK